MRYSDCIGAIALTRGKSWISRVISWGQRLLGRPCRFIPSHVVIVASCAYPASSTTIWEATVGGVSKHKLASYVGPGHETYIAYLKGLSPAQRSSILQWAKRFEGRGYGYLDLLVYFVDLLGFRCLKLKRGWLTGRLNTKRFLVCSEFVGYVYGRALHYRFRDGKGRWIRPSELTPLDIWEHIKRHPDEWEVVQISPEGGAA